MRQKDITRPVYLDYAAATPVDPEVIRAMTECLGQSGVFGNPHSKDHVYGWDAAAAVEDARAAVADQVGCSPLELTFTSGATESDNLAIMGLAHALRRRGDGRTRIITSAIEHRAVLEACGALESEGFSITYVKPRPDGSIDVDLLKQHFDSSVFLVSVMHANSELGTLSDIFELAQWCRERGAFFHTDAAQTAGSLHDLGKSAVSMASLTAAKAYGPKGMGALYVSREQQVPLLPLISGGGQEKGLRGGTVPTHQAAGMGKAFELLKTRADSDLQHQEQIRDLLCTRLSAAGDVSFNERRGGRLPGILSVSFAGIDGAQLLPSLRQVACSSGSACASADLEPSYVLTGIGLTKAQARASLRLSFGRFTTTEDAERAAEDIVSTVKQLRGR